MPSATPGRSSASSPAEPQVRVGGVHEDAAFLESLMDTSLYSLGAAFQDDHPELVEEVIAEADVIEAAGLQAWATAESVSLQSAFQTLLTGLALRYYRALGA